MNESTNPKLIRHLVIALAVYAFDGIFLGQGVIAALIGLFAIPIWL